MLLCRKWHRLNARATGQMARYLSFAAVTVAWFERKEQSPLSGALRTLAGHRATADLGQEETLGALMIERPTAKISLSCATYDLDWHGSKWTVKTDPIGNEGLPRSISEVTTTT